jgi:capsular polysaccharide biosynthesis protein
MGAVVTDEYEQLKQRLRALVDAIIPAGATVLVVADHDSTLLPADGRRVWNFPRSYTGKPQDSGDAIRQLDAIRAQGRAYLVLPQPALWWLEHYRELRQHLESEGRLLVSHPDTAVVFEIPVKHAAPGGARDIALRIGNVKHPAPAVDRAGLLEHGDATRFSWQAGNDEICDFGTALDLSASAGIDRVPLLSALGGGRETYPPPHFYGLRNCHVLPVWAFAFGPDGIVEPTTIGIAEWFSPDLSALPGLARSGEEVWAPAEFLDDAPTIEGPHLLLHHRAARNYGHWMMDCLPGAWALGDEIRAGRLRLLSRPLRTWQRQTLEALGLPIESVTESTSDVVRCEHLIVPSFLSGTGFGRPSRLLEACFREVAHGCPRPTRPAPGPPRVFVARESTDFRAMRNESELIAALEPRGFAAVFPGRLSIAEQVHLFADAECVVGAHGSGMFNVAYTKPGSRVVEISPAGANPRFWIARLSAVLGLHYAIVAVDVSPEDRDETMAFGEIRRDINFRFDADIPAVLHALDVFGVY